MRRLHSFRIHFYQNESCRPDSTARSELPRLKRILKVSLSIILWSSRDLTPSCPVDMCQRFGETYSQYLQGRICPGFSETMAPIYQNKGHRSPECSSLHIQRHKNFKPQIIFTVSRYCIRTRSSKSQWWSNVSLLHVYVCANMICHLYFVVLNV